MHRRGVVSETCMPINQKRKIKSYNFGISVKRNSVGDAGPYSITPVSYTHLDVYKRQSLFSFN